MALLHLHLHSKMSCSSETFRLIYSKYGIIAEDMNNQVAKHYIWVHAKQHEHPSLTTVLSFANVLPSSHKRLATREISVAGESVSPEVFTHLTNILEEFELICWTSLICCTAAQSN